MWQTPVTSFQNGKPCPCALRIAVCSACSCNRELEKVRFAAFGPGGTSQSGPLKSRELPYTIEKPHMLKVIVKVWVHGDRCTAGIVPEVNPDLAQKVHKMVTTMAVKCMPDLLLVRDWLGYDLGEPTDRHKWTPSVSVDSFSEF
jgi:hypothetical protein